MRQNELAQLNQVLVQQYNAEQTALNKLLNRDKNISVEIASELIIPAESIEFNAEKGFGLIERGDGEKDLFVHKSEVQDQLAEGDKVEFEIGEGKKGPCATNVKKV